MISYNKELRVRELISEGRSLKSISRETGVSFAAVQKISESCKVCERLDSGVRGQVCSLLLAGLSPSAVATKLNIPHDTVVAVRRVNFIRPRRVDKPTKCPTCGATAMPECEPGKHKPARIPQSIRQKDSQSLFVLADDVTALASSHTVHNILFYNLADRARAIINSITGEPDGQ